MLETQAYRVSGSVEIFPQHCQVPFLLWNEHLQAIIDELATTLQEIQPEKHGKFLSAIYSRLQSTQSNTPTRTLTAPIQAWMLSQDDIQLNPFVPPADEQRVTLEQMVIPEAIDQRVPTNDNTL